MNEYGDLSDKQLLELEESLYDDELEGANNWFERDKVLWEINRRGLSAKWAKQV